ncbi:MAG: hypothetical protein D6744_04510 [Planctomycetota bacterium]|nr:MAG: hypothetical protein D6744_04510 [Planctomycetota bacterium]
MRYLNNRNNNYYVLTARQVQDVEEGALIEKGFRAPGPTVSYFWVDQPTLLWIDGNERLVRFAAAEGALCEFDTAGNEVTFTAYVKNGRDFEVGKSETVLSEQKVGPIPVPIRFPVRPAMVDLRTLAAWRQRPWTAPDLSAQIRAFSLRHQIYRLYRRIGVELQRGNALVLTDDHGRRYEFSALEISGQDRALRVADARLVRYDPDESAPTRFEAPRGVLVIRGDAEGRLTARIHLEQDERIPVLQYNPRTGDAAEPLRVDRADAGGLALPSALLAEIPPPAPESVVDPTQPLEVHPSMATELETLRRDSRELKRKVAGLIHARLGFAGSPLVTILMGAALGVIFRGSRMLAGFGLACIPFGLTALLILMGRQLIEGNEASVVGPLIVWGGLGLVLAADLVLLRLGVQR